MLTTNNSNNSRIYQTTKSITHRTWTMLCAWLNLLCLFLHLLLLLLRYFFWFSFSFPIFQNQIGRFCFHNKYNKNSVKLVVPLIIKFGVHQLRWSDVILFTCGSIWLGLELNLIFVFYNRESERNLHLWTCYSINFHYERNKTL